MIKAAKRLESVESYFFARKLKEIAQRNADGADIINLGIGSPDLSPPQEVVKELMSSVQNPNAHQYQSYYGIKELKSAFRNFYQKQFDINLSPMTQILPLMGSKEGIMHISMAFLEKGDQVLVPDPGYPAYQMATTLAEAETIRYPLTEENGWLLDLGQLAKQDLSKVKLMWVNYPHMPTGAKADNKLFEELIQFGEQNEILICHDNPYAFILNDHPISIMEHSRISEYCLELISLSKSFNMAGWRVGALVAHNKIIETVMKFKSNMDSGMFKPIQLAAAKALTMDQKWFQDLNVIYQERKNIAVEIFDYLQCSYEIDTAGLFVWAKVPNKNGAFWSEKLLDEAEVFLTPGFIFGKNGEQYLRLSLCSDQTIFSEALKRIKKSIKL